MNETDHAGRLDSALCEGLGAGDGARCMCKDRALSACPGEWEPGCDLGNNSAHVQRVAVDEVHDIDRKMFGGLLSCVGCGAPAEDPHMPNCPIEAPNVRAKAEPAAPHCPSTE